MRKWSPTECENSEKGETVYQIVVPTVHRREVLELAHDLPMSGHLGVRKTHNRVLQHFFWPGLKRDVAKWCKECHTCQLGGKPNQNIPQAPLHPIPAFDEPFSHIIIDSVGLLPKTKSQNEYLLTIMCISTRFPEAIPLRRIKTNTILKALIKFFTLFGLPKSIQSDRYQFYGSCIPTGNDEPAHHDRVESPPQSRESDIQTVGNSSSGQVCHSPQHASSPVHGSSSGASSTDDRCFVTGLAGEVNVHVSTISPAQQSHSEAQTTQTGEVILIAPWWSLQPWFPHLLRLSVDHLL